MRTDYRIFPWLKQGHGGAHAGHRGAHGGGAGAKPAKAVVKADGEAAAMLAELPVQARQAAYAAGLREIKVLGKREYNKEIAGDRSVRAGWESVAVMRGDGTMLLRKDNPNLRKTFYHELAHALDPIGDTATFKISESPEWLKASGWKQDKRGNYKLRSTIENRPVSEYGKSNPWEDFAESFGKYVTGSKFDRRVMQGESAGRYEYVAKLAGSLGIKVE